MNVEPEILFNTIFETGVITLNRPKVLNSLNLNMVRSIQSQLHIWAKDAQINRVILNASGDKIFCAGGDIRALYELGKQDRFEEALQFWREEYQLNRFIKHFPKPFISLIDGLVMGGGFGLSAHGSHIVAGDNYQFSMPEVGIGFFPDVGATYVLPRLPSFIGNYIALSGVSIGPEDAIEIGLATHMVQSTYMQNIMDELVYNSDTNRILRKYSAAYKQPKLDNNRAIIHSAFSETSVIRTLDKLEKFALSGSDFAGKTAAIIRSKSPCSLNIVHKQMKYGLELEFDAAMVLEFRIVSRLGCAPDFFEGVRASIIDKDKKPIWTTDRLEDIAQSDIDYYFAPLHNDELTFE
jgi:enoyl-CoA hydratase